MVMLLVVIDECTRECLAIETGRTFTAREVLLTLQYLFAVRGAPEYLRSDNGPEFVAKEISLVEQGVCWYTVYSEGQPLGEWIRGKF